MSNITRKISFPFVLLILFFIKGSVSLESKNQGQAYQLKKTLETSKSLEKAPDYGKLPLYFIPNEGQVDKKALFYAKASEYTLWLTKEGLIFDSTRRMKKENTESPFSNPRDANEPDSFTCERDVSRLLFLNSNKNPEMVPVDRAEYRVNYFMGQDKSKWRTNIQTSRGILYKELYRNIDLKVYGIEDQIEYDFIVRPGGEVSNISFEYRDVEKTEIDKEGNLVIRTEFGEIKHVEPVCYQIISEERVEVEANFEKIENNNYGFKVKGYNKNYELIIDPWIFAYSTFLGGSSNEEEGSSIAVDSEGAAYVTGYTTSSDFPTYNPLQESKAGIYDVFITKINAEGTALVYSTYLGGEGIDDGFDIAVDSEGAAYVTGRTGSDDFPAKSPIQENNAGHNDVFITKINSSGNGLVYSTYLGGSGLSGDWSSSIAVDSEGAAYVTGYTGSTDFPTQNPFQASNAGKDDVFITKINAEGTALVYSTYLGGSYNDFGQGIAVDAEGAAYLTGWTTGGVNSTEFPTKNPFQESHAGGWDDIFVTKMNAEGTALVYSTYLGGYGMEWGYDLAVDVEGAAYVTGRTSSDDFPTYNPLQERNAGGWDAFVAKINAEGTALVYSTYLGGSGYDIEQSQSIAVDAKGAAYVTGRTGSDDFPTYNPLQERNAGGYDAFVAKINAKGTALIYSTYLGGYGSEGGIGIAVDTEGAVYVTGHTGSADFPTYNPLQESIPGSHYAFITKLCDAYSLTITAGKGGTTDPSPGTCAYCPGTEAIVEAIPDVHYIFSHWSGDVSSSENPISITMNSDKSLTANFIRQCTLVLASNAGGTTDPSPGIYKFDVGAEVTLTAIPDMHYRFSHWSGDISGADNPIKITMNLDMSITANFTRIIYAPLNFTGQKVLNRSLSQAEYINVLTWQANPDNINIAKYRIYLMEGESVNLLVELDANTIQYWHRRIEKDKTYTYAICAVNNEYREGDPAHITVQ